MQESTDTKQEAGKVSNSSSTDLLAELFRETASLRFDIVSNNRCKIIQEYSIWKRHTEVMQKVEQALSSQSETIADRLRAKGREIKSGAAVDRDLR